MQAKDRIIVALDVDSREEAMNLAGELHDLVGAFKIGMQLFNSEGPSIVRAVNELGGRVFIDLKLHDIPNTVAQAGRVLTRLNAFMFNVHAAGGRQMMAEMAGQVHEEAARLGIEIPKMLAVTVLTSISETQLKEELMVEGLALKELVRKWAVMAQQAGLDGVVCSPQEIVAVREACGRDFIIVTPGIRPRWSEKNDQVRVTTPRDALDMGADYMVIGRPICKAESPRQAARMIIEELEG